jgi:hypothetical protein
MKVAIAALPEATRAFQAGNGSPDTTAMMQPGVWIKMQHTGGVCSHGGETCRKGVDSSCTMKGIAHLHVHSRNTAAASAACYSASCRLCATSNACCMHTALMVQLPSMQTLVQHVSPDNA